MAKIKMYNVYCEVVRGKNKGARLDRMNLTPMNHDEACIFKSKLTPHVGKDFENNYIIVEVGKMKSYMTARKTD